MASNKVALSILFVAVMLMINSSYASRLHVVRHDASSGEKTKGGARLHVLRRDTSSGTKGGAHLHVLRREGSSGKGTKGGEYIEGSTYGQSQQAMGNGEAGKNDDGSPRHCYGKCTARCVNPLPNDDPSLTDLCAQKCKAKCQL